MVCCSASSGAEVANLAEAQPDREINAARRLPRRSTLRQTEQSGRRLGARGCGITVDQAERLTTDKGEWLLYRAHVKGESTAALLPNMVATSLAKLPIPETNALGCKRRALRASGAHRDPAAGRQSHSCQPFWHSVRSRDSRPPLYGLAGITIDNADQYPESCVSVGKVIADYEERKAKIKADAEEAARKIGGNADLSESLLEEVASLVEWPVVLTAKFEEKFLAVPFLTIGPP